MKATSPKFRSWLRDGMVYGLLIIGSLIFMWPFLWMATASVKVDRELFAEDAGLWPMTPYPRKASPFLETRGIDSLSHPRKADVLPALEAYLAPRVGPWPGSVTPAEANPVLAKAVFKRIKKLAPDDWWYLDTPDLITNLQSLITPSILTAERANVLRGLVIGQLVLRSFDLQEKIAIVPDRIEESWTIGGSGKANFAEKAEVADQGRMLEYDFASGGSVTLTTTVDAGFDLDRLQRVQLFLRPDDTWHAIECTMEMQGKKYRAERAGTLFDTNWLTLTWQRPGPDDLTNQQKIWTLLREEAAGSQFESRPGHIKIQIELRQRSLLEAWSAKIIRNYQTVLEHIPFGRYVATSLFLVILQVVCTILSCSLVAYSFARLRWPGRGACFLLMIGTLMLPGQVTMIPHFLIIRELGWYNTLLPLWVPALGANAFFVFLLYQFMKGIPKELEDAARIDGCGVLRTYWHVIMPMLKPSLAAIGIFTFMGVWNDFMGPLIYLQDQRLYPLSLGLYALNVQSGGSMGMMMAGSLLMTLPVILLFFFAQRYFLRGITLTGMK